MQKLEKVIAGIKIGPITLSGTWKPDETERKASWEMYVELITRIATQKLHYNEGLLREALSSLYSIFDSTRIILKSYGPSIAKAENKISFGVIAVLVLNKVLRPLLAKWHPLLLEYEETKQSNISSLKHEKNWDRYEELRKDIDNIREPLIQWAKELEEAANIPALIDTYFLNEEE